MLRLRRDIPLFPDGKKKAVTLSFDDGVIQDMPFIELLNKYHMKGTFNLNSGLLGKHDWLVQPGLDVNHYKINEDEVEQIYTNHEVAIHTLTHIDLTTVPNAVISYEIAEDKERLERITGKIVRGMAYPFGNCNERVERVLECCGVEYGRTISSTGRFELPKNFLHWNPTCYYRDENTIELADKFVQSDCVEYEQPQLFYMWGHTYEFDGRNHWQLIESILEILSNHDTIWYATNIQISEYMTAVRNLVYSANGDYIYNPFCIDVWMLIDQKVYCIKSGQTVRVINEE